MMTEIDCGRYTVRGVSLGGMYTSIHVPELDALFDVGAALRPAIGVTNLFLSHAHVDHIGALPAFLGMRGLTGVKKTLRVFCPAEIAEQIPIALNGFSAMHRWPLEVECVPMEPGDEVELRKDMIVRAFKTFHPVPSLGYLLFTRVRKLRPEFAHLSGPEIGLRRRKGDDSIFDIVERRELAYATDTLPTVLERSPEILDARTLIIECTFLDKRKSVKAARAGCHIHMDELLPMVPSLQNETIVLMHFSQLYKPGDVRRIVRERWPREAPVLIPFVPRGDLWWN